ISHAIFSSDESMKYGSLDHWRSRLSDPSSFILYLSPTSEPARPVAFTFVILREYDPPIREHTTGLQIWIAGASPDWRNSGCLTRMVHELDDTPMLTICIFPSRFEAMWNWLLRRGWEVERDLGGGKVMLSR
ncbi:hypothetical protein FKP32DRAFT_1549029, partial [Trametes sanguinea]